MATAADFLDSPAPAPTPSGAYRIDIGTQPTVSAASFLDGSDDNVARETGSKDSAPQKPGTTTLPSAVETPLSLLASAGGRVENALGGIAETLEPLTHYGTLQEPLGPQQGVAQVVQGELTGNTDNPTQAALKRGTADVNQDVSAIENAHPLLGNVGAFTGDVLPYAAAPMGGTLKAASGIGGLIGAIQGITKPVETGEDYNRADAARIAEDTALGAAGPTLIKGAASTLSGLSEPVKYIARAIGATPDKVQTAVIQAAQDSGITDLPLSAQTQSRFVRSMESYLQNSGMTGDIYDKLKNGFDSSFSKSYADMLDSVSADRRPAAVIGEQGQASAKEAADAHQQLVGTAYNQLEDKLNTLSDKQPTSDIPASSKFARDYLSQAQSLVPSQDEKLVSRVMQQFAPAEGAAKPVNVGGRMFSPGTPEYEAFVKQGFIQPPSTAVAAQPVSRLLATRRSINSMLNSNEMGGVRQVLQGFSGALGQDIKAGLAGTPHAADLAKADELFGNQVKTYRNGVLTSMIFGQTPENVIKSLTEPSDVAKLEAALADPKYKPVVDAIKRARISDILGTKLYDNAGNIRVGNFAGAFREDQRNGPLLQALVGPQQWKKLQNLRAVASGVQEGSSQFLNSSKTAYARTDLGIAATAAAQAVQGIIQMAHGNLLAGVSLIGSGLATSYTPYLGARLLTSPAFIRASTRAANTLKSDPSAAGTALRTLAQTVTAAAPATRRSPANAVGATSIAAPPDMQTINPKAANDYVSKTVAHESGGNPNARAKTSGAVGAGQFIPKTWARMIENYRPELMMGKSLRQIMDLRRDPALSREMTAHYAEENGEQLRKAGLPVNDTTRYLAHFLGPTDTKRLLNAKIGTPAAQVLSPASVRANRSVLAGKKAEDVLRWAQKAMGNLPEPAAGPPQR